MNAGVLRVSAWWVAYLAFLAKFVIVVGTTAVTLVPAAACVIARSTQHKKLRGNTKQRPDACVRKNDTGARILDSTNMCRGTTYLLSSQYLSPT